MTEKRYQILESRKDYFKERFFINNDGQVERKPASMGDLAFSMTRISTKAELNRALAREKLIIDMLQRGSKIRPTYAFKTYHYNVGDIAMLVKNGISCIHSEKVWGISLENYLDDRMMVDLAIINNDAEYLIDNHLRLLTFKQMMGDSVKLAKLERDEAQAKAKKAQAQQLDNPLSVVSSMNLTGGE